MTNKECIERIDEVLLLLKSRHMCESMSGDCTKEDIEDYRARFEALQMARKAVSTVK